MDHAATRALLAYGVAVPLTMPWMRVYQSNVGCMSGMMSKIR